MQNDFTVSGVQIRFPHKPYPSQIEFCESVVKGIQESKVCLLESPTGTGKTAAILTALLAVQQLNVGEGSEPFKIYYATRTHSQTSGIITQLKKTVYGKLTNSVVLASRSKLCINGAARKLVSSGNGSLNEVCSKMRKESSHMRNSEEMPRKRSRQNIGVCPFFPCQAERGFNFTAEDPRTPLDIEDMLKKGKKDSKCSYYASKVLQENAKLIICTYNHLLYPYVRKFSQIEIENAVLVFDEAHNIEGICRTLASKTLQLRNVDDIIFIMDEFEMNHKSACSSSVNWNLVKNSVNRLAKLLHQLSKPSCQGFTRYPKEEAMGMSDTFAKLVECGWGPEEVLKIKAAYEALGEELDEEIEFPETLAQMITSFDYLYRVTTKNDKSGIYECEDYTLMIVKPLKKTIKSTEVVRSLEDLSSSIELRLICNNAAIVFKELTEKARSIIIISGTLSPLRVFAAELGLPTDTIQKSFGQVLPTNRLFTCYLGGTPGEQNCFTFKYETMKLKDGKLTPEFKKRAAQLSNAVCEIFRTVPNGNIVFFPSRIIMERFLECWKESKRFCAMEKIKPVYVEVQGELFQSDIVSKYKTDAKSPKGAILFAYIRGQASEGVDFKDQEARAVVTVGIPFASMDSIEVKSKKDFNDTRKRQDPQKYPVGGQEWYTAEAFRALNQGIGRCIRHKDDWGCVFIIEHRLMSGWGQKSISGWVNRRGSFDRRIGHNMDEVLPHLKDFVKRMDT